jgi:hypothetical protein
MGVRGGKKGQRRKCSSIRRVEGDGEEETKRGRIKRRAAWTKRRRRRKEAEEERRKIRPMPTTRPTRKSRQTLKKSRLQKRRKRNPSFLSAKNAQKAKRRLISRPAQTDTRLQEEEEEEEAVVVEEEESCQVLGRSLQY